MPQHFDYLLIGGGLQNSLLVQCLLELQPGARIALVERDLQLGGNHTWCFHAGDIPAGRISTAIEPLVSFRWPGYEVRFPNRVREVEAQYCGVSSARLNQVVSSNLASAPGCELMTGAEAVEIGEHEVLLGDGRRITGELVVDGRGPLPGDYEGSAGYQKFVGLEIELASPHALTRPCLMDATVEQIDGFRFIYTLPLSPTRLLIEDTYFSDNPDLDRPALRKGIRDYAASRGYAISSVEREEVGVLPMPWKDEIVEQSLGPLVAGYRGGWFHPGTGYSFPVALRLAAFIASRPATSVFGEELLALSTEHQRQARYCHRLNAMLFRWFAPEDRWNVFERFYGLPEPLIRRFYALELNSTDRARILIGKPPRGLSVRRGLARRFVS